jgi:type IV pilus assembly protein PilM
MAKQPVGVWGIDLGQCGLKAIRLEESEGQVVATAFDFVEHPKILSQPDADPDQLTREALEKFLSRNQLRGDIVAISVPGQSGLARFVKLPPVEEKKIGDIVRFEAKQQIPFNLDEVVWDYQKLGQGVVTDGFAMETEIGLFAMKRDMVNRYLQHFRDVHVDIHIVQMAPLALCNFIAFDLLKKGPEGEADSAKRTCVVALDIGTDSSNLIITDGGRIIWQRPIPLGGNHFTRALTKDLKLTFAKAEHLKRNAIKSPELKKILASIKPVLNDFVGEVQRSLGYFTNTHRDVPIEYMVGLGNAFRLPGLQRYMSEKLQIEVRKLEKMERLTGDSVVGAPAFGENILSFAVAYGLAVQGLKQARVLTNLLPAEIRVERLIKAKKPWAVAGAAALLLAIGGMTLGYGMAYRAYGGSAAEDAKKGGAGGGNAFVDAFKSKDQVVQKISQANSAFDSAKTAAENEGKAIESITTGQKEVFNWLALSNFLDEAVPRPEDAGEQFSGGKAQLASAEAKKAGVIFTVSFRGPSWEVELLIEGVFKGDKQPSDDKPKKPEGFQVSPRSTIKNVSADGQPLVVGGRRGLTLQLRQGKQSLVLKRTLGITLVKGEQTTFNEATPVAISTSGNGFDFNRPVTLVETGLSPEAERKYGERARLALQEWRQWQAGKSAGHDADSLADGVEELLQFNIEAVSTRYSTNLPAYWKNVLNNLNDVARDTNIRPREDIKAGPAEGDKGWVVELRGYTFHKEKTNFVIDTLVERLAHIGAEKKLGWPLPGDAATPAAPGAPAGAPGAGGEQGQHPPRAISHVALYNSSLKPASTSGNFEIITATRLDTLIGVTPQAGGVGGMKPTGAGTPSPVPAAILAAGVGQTGGWRPLASDTLGESGAPGAAGNERVGARPVPPSPSRDPGSTPSTPSIRGPKRTEFVIVFIWREPTPSDNLLTKQEGTAASGQGGMNPTGMNP